MRFPLWLTVLVLAGCIAAPVPPPSPADPAFAALNLHRVGVGPVAYATYQPGESCSTFIDEELRSALKRELRRRGYDAFAVGNSVPRSFAGGSPPPLSGAPPPVVPLLSSAGEGVLLVWIEEYFENTLCGWEGPKYLTMGAVAVLYAGSPPREVWRQQARAAEQGYYVSQEIMWLVTSRLSEGLLQALPAAGNGEVPR